jgi:hypothetical protein
MYQAPFPSRHHLQAVCLCLMLCMAQAVAAGALPPEDGPVGFIPPPPPGEKWQEQAFVLPSYPGESRLLELDIDTGTSPFRYYLDPESLSIDKDRVVRFTTVIVSPSGVRNVTYEGLHCGERTHRRLAYGSGGIWHALPDAPWQRITGSGTQRYRKTLYERYMCPATETSRSTEQILRRLRSGRSITGD